MTYMVCVTTVIVMVHHKHSKELDTQMWRKDVKSSFNNVEFQTSKRVAFLRTREGPQKFR